MKTSYSSLRTAHAPYRGVQCHRRSSAKRRLRNFSSIFRCDLGLFSRRKRLIACDLDHRSPEIAFYRERRIVLCEHRGNDLSRQNLGSLVVGTLFNPEHRHDAIGRRRRVPCRGHRNALQWCPPFVGRIRIRNARPRRSETNPVRRPASRSSSDLIPKTCAGRVRQRKVVRSASPSTPGYASQQLSWQPFSSATFSSPSSS
jgi:hypothetical protein